MKKSEIYKLIEDNPTADFETRPYAKTNEYVKRWVPLNVFIEKTPGVIHIHGKEFNTNEYEVRIKQQLKDK